MNKEAVELALIQISNIAYNMSHESTRRQFDSGKEFTRIKEMAEHALKEFKKDGR